MPYREFHLPSLDEVAEHLLAAPEPPRADEVGVMRLDLQSSDGQDVDVVLDSLGRSAS